MVLKYTINIRSGVTQLIARGQHYANASFLRILLAVYYCGAIWVGVIIGIGFKTDFGKAHC